MNPQDILKRVPKTNCGECDYPSCLAFAANVAKSGANPHKCPYIDLTGLELHASKETELKQLGKEHDLSLIAHLKDKIKELNFQTLAPLLQAKCANNRLFFSFLNQQVEVSKSALLINQQEPLDPRDQILIYNYIHFGGGHRPDQNWIGLESVPNSISKIRTLATYCEDKLSHFFTGKSRAEIHAYCQHVGGNITEKGASDIGAIIPVLPQIPQQLLFWEEDLHDGFEAKVKILYPANVMDYLDIESLVFTSERMAELIIDATIDKP